MPIREGAAVVLAVSGAAALLARSVQASLDVRRTRPGAQEPQRSVHGADPVTLVALEAIIVALGLVAGWFWALVLGAAGAAALVRFARTARVEVSPDAVVFGTGAAAVSLPFDRIGSVVLAPRSAVGRSYGTVGVADPRGAWVAVLRPAAVRRPGRAVAALVQGGGLEAHPDERCWRRRGAAPATGRLPFVVR